MADEINRTPPKTQSALLEAMQEEQATIDGTSHALAPGFFVIATQNPVEFEGTYPLPEAQLDRFLLRVEIGAAGRGRGDRRSSGAPSRAVLAGGGPRCRRRSSRPRRPLALRRSARGVHVADELLDYLQQLADRGAPLAARRARREPARCPGRAGGGARDGPARRTRLPGAGRPEARAGRGLGAPHRAVGGVGARGPHARAA